MKTKRIEDGKGGGERSTRERKQAGERVV